MQTSKERVLAAIRRMPPDLPLEAFCDRLSVLVSIQKDLEELAARASEPSRDVQTGAKMATDYLQALDKLDESVPLRNFLERLDLIDSLRRSAQDIAAGRYFTHEEVLKRLKWRKSAGKRRTKPKKTKRLSRSGSRK